MDLSILDKSAEVTPHLVRLYDNHQLYSLAKDKGPEARIELVNAVSEVLAMDSSEREAALIADILTTLTRQAENDLRLAISERLALMDNAPLRLILMLANDEIEIAAPVLRHSNVLGELDLIYIIKSKGAAHWKSIAQRVALTAKVVDVLAQTHDIDTAMALIENDSARLTQNALTIFSDMVEQHEDLALPILGRDEATKDIVTKIYKSVGEELKSYIKVHHEVDARVIGTVERVLGEYTQQHSESDTAADPALLKAAHQQIARDTLKPETMIKTLRRGQAKAFVAQFSAYTGLSTRSVIEMLKLGRGYGLAAACKAFEISKADFLTLFLLTNTMRTKARLADMKEMGQAMERYDSLTRESALDIVKKY